MPSAVENHNDRNSIADKSGQIRPKFSDSRSQSFKPWNAIVRAGGTEMPDAYRVRLAGERRPPCDLRRFFGTARAASPTARGRHRLVDGAAGAAVRYAASGTVCIVQVLHRPGQPRRRSGLDTAAGLRERFGQVLRAHIIERDRHHVRYDRHQHLAAAPVPVVASRPLRLSKHVMGIGQSTSGSLTSSAVAIAAMAASNDI